MKHISITADNSHTYEQALKEFESNFSYPLGEDRFQISHGESYFNFFQRMGDWQMEALEIDGKICATGVGVYRENFNENCWYLADLKVLQSFQGRGLPVLMMKKSYLSFIKKCNKFYAISMNDKNRKNRIGRILSAIEGIDFHQEEELLFYTFNHRQYCQLKDNIEGVLGEITLVSLSGVKDIILKSTGAPMPLVHIHHGNSYVEEKVKCNASEGHQYMICGTSNGMVSKICKTQSILPMASASVYQSCYPEIELDSLLTCDI